MNHLLGTVSCLVRKWRSYKSSLTQKMFWPGAILQPGDVLHVDSGFAPSGLEVALLSGPVIGPEVTSRRPETLLAALVNGQGCRHGIGTL